MKYRVNYSKVITQAGYIMNQAEALSKQIQMLYQMELEYRQVWRGEAAEAFIKKLFIYEKKWKKQDYRWLICHLQLKCALIKFSKQILI